MIIRCSQCGAKINRTDQNRFFNCPFCASSLVLEGRRSFTCFIMEHERNDLWARALFHERLRRTGIAEGRGAVNVELSYIPFWVVRRPDGAVMAHPAAGTPGPGLSPLRMPPGRLALYDQAGHANAPVLPISIGLEQAIGDAKHGENGRVDLVYLPVYCLRSDDAGPRHDSLLVADSSRLHSKTGAETRRRIPARPLLLFAAAAVFFAAAGILAHDVYLRAAAIGIGGLAFVIVSPLIIGREG